MLVHRSIVVFGSLVVWVASRFSYAIGGLVRASYAIGGLVQKESVCYVVFVSLGVQPGGSISHKQIFVQCQVLLVQCSRDCANARSQNRFFVCPSLIRSQEHWLCKC